MRQQVRGPPSPPGTWLRTHSCRSTHTSSSSSPTQHAALAPCRRSLPAHAAPQPAGTAEERCPAHPGCSHCRQRSYLQGCFRVGGMRAQPKRCASCYVCSMRIAPAMHPPCLCDHPPHTHTCACRNLANQVRLHHVQPPRQLLQTFLTCLIAAHLQIKPGRQSQAANSERALLACHSTFPKAGHSCLMLRVINPQLIRVAVSEPPMTLSATHSDSLHASRRQHPTTLPTSWEQPPT